MNTTIQQNSGLTNIVSFIAGSILLIGLSVATPHSTAFAADAAAIHVQLNDLDLSSQAGQQKAYQRVRKAARTVCWRVSDPQDIGFADSPRHVHRYCRKAG